jgi:RNA-directed DNA polymerase
MSSIAWKDVQWPLVEQRILRIQERIFQASKLGNKDKVLFLQKKIIHSFDAKLLAVRKVTTENKGKNTAGIDQKLYITPIEKLKLTKQIKIDGKAFPIRRVYIPKPGKQEKRPLGIPVIKDRAKQALCLLALEPEWEALFETNSYGFRPGRSCQDAIEAIFLTLRNSNQNPNSHKYVLDADISKCFDQIDHNYLCKKLQTLPIINKQIKAWLEAGIMENWKTNQQNLAPNTKGTPQGGVLSPFLCNVALHGMETAIKDWIETKPSYNTQRGIKAKRQSISLIRYADDFVIIHLNKSVIIEAKEIIDIWLKTNPKLNLNTTKTTISSTKNGFNFLGFSIIHISRNNMMRTKIYPSRNSQARFLLNIRDVIKKNRNTSAYNLIQILRPKILGWANYYKYSECKDVFLKITNQIHNKIRAWVFRRDTRNGRLKIKQTYFPSGRIWTFDESTHQDNWILYGKQTLTNNQIKEAWLPHMVWVKSQKWVKIQGTASIYDGNSVYWAKRSIKYGNWSLRKRRLIIKQNGKCNLCGMNFFPDSFVEVDHIKPVRLGGKDTYDNLQLLHKHCHIAKTRHDTCCKFVN